MANKVYSKKLMSEAQRYEIVKRVLKHYHEDKDLYFQKSDVSWFLKELLQNNVVCISKKAYEKVKKGTLLWTNIPTVQEVLEKNPKLLERWDNIINHRPQTTCIQDYINRKEFAWEHAVPTSVLIDQLIESDGSLESYREICSKGFVCIVTKAEDKALTEAGLIGSMPDKWDGKDLWARYKKAGIEII